MDHIGEKEHYVIGGFIKVAENKKRLISIVLVICVGIGLFVINKYLIPKEDKVDSQPLNAENKPIDEETKSIVKHEYDDINQTMLFIDSNLSIDEYFIDDHIELDILEMSPLEKTPKFYFEVTDPYGEELKYTGKQKSFIYIEEEDIYYTESTVYIPVDKSQEYVNVQIKRDNVEFIFKCRNPKY